MKKLLFFVTMVAVLLASCAKDNVTMPQPEGSNLVSFKVSSPEMQTRYGEGTTANKLMWAVYFEGKLLEDVSALTLDEAQEINFSTEVVLDLVNGLTYDILFWAQAEDAPYAFDGEKVTIDYASLTANEEKYDAFFKNYKAVIDDSTPHSVELKRPFAQLNIGTGDIDKAEKAGFILENTSITVETCTVLDLVTGVASEPKEMTFAMNTKPDDTYKEYEIIALNYLLVNSEKEFIDVTFEAEGSGDSINREYLNVPIQRNHRTYILGDLLTKSSMFEVFINPIFDDDYFVRWSLYYTSSDGNIVVPNNEYVFGADIIDNVYEDGRGKITFDSPVTSIGRDAFRNCSTLVSIDIPDSVTEIGAYAFSSCSSLSSIDIPDGVVNIDSGAFQYCTNLTTVSMGDYVERISDKAFYYCNNLTRVDITNLSTWCNIVFYDAYSTPLYYTKSLYLNGEEITELTIPSDVTQIERYTFYNLKNLTRVNIHDSVVRIGDSAFAFCRNLTNLVVPDSVTSIGERAFYSCSGLTNIDLGNGLQRMSSYAFSGCTGLTSITIPDSVTSIGNSAFSDCPNLEAFYGKFASADNRCLIEFKSLIAFAPAGITSYIIPDGVNTIERGAFTSCKNLTDVTIPESVTEIQWNAFLGIGLTSVTIPGGVTTIEEGTFTHCEDLATVTLGEGVSIIEASAFANCYNLESINIPKSVTRIEKGYSLGAFYGCDKLVRVDITDLSAWCRIEFESNPLSCGAKLYLNDIEVTELTIPSDITTIKSYVFNGCSSLVSVAVHDGVTKIGSYAFSDCENLEDINIPDGVTTLGSRAFYGCKRLTSIDIPDSVTNIESYTFCASGLTEVLIPDSVTKIGQYAFFGCDSMTSVTIGSGVTSIGGAAFGYSDNLKTVYCRSVIPPTGTTDMFDKNAYGRTIYVPAESVDAYKTAAGWSQYAYYIKDYTFVD